MVHRDMKNEDNSGKIQEIGTSRYFIVRQVPLLGVSDFIFLIHTLSP